MLWQLGMIIICVMERDYWLGKQRWQCRFKSSKLRSFCLWKLYISSRFVKDNTGQHSKFAAEGCTAVPHLDLTLVRLLDDKEVVDDDEEVLLDDEEVVVVIDAFETRCLGEMWFLAIRWTVSGRYPLILELERMIQYVGGVNIIIKAFIPIFGYRLKIWKVPVPY